MRMCVWRFGMFCWRYPLTDTRLFHCLFLFLQPSLVPEKPIDVSEQPPASKKVSEMEWNDALHACLSK